MITQRSRDHPTKVVAHRGASGYAPENTLEAFRLALEMNAAYIELDVHMSRDHRIIVIHDSRVDRTTNGRGRVADLTAAELSTLDAGSWFNRRYPGRVRAEFAGAKIPLLQEVVDMIKGTRAGLYVEIKDPELYPDDFVVETVSLLARSGFEKRVVLLSFSAKSVEKVRLLNSSLRTALLIGKRSPDPVSSAVATGACELAIGHTLLTPRLMAKARRAGLLVAVWTANSSTAIRRALVLGADRIISNYPDRALRLLIE
jgi:glycerophosphoryl diester phosphodiesterase